jgi:hypothetical protein
MANTNFPPGGTGTDPNAIHDNVAAEISGIPVKGSPTAADILVGEDAANGFAKIQIPIGNLPTIPGDAQTLIVPAIKATAGTINPGQVVYIVGFDAGNSAITVELADASGGSTMPAYGLADATITDSAVGNLVVAGTIGGFNTSAFAVGDEVFVSDTTLGGLVNARPDGAALVQQIGTVTVSDAVNGVVQVTGAGRVNALPNLPQDFVWVGDANGLPQPVNKSTLGAPLTSTAPVNVTKAAAVVGVSTEAARSDHKHDVDTAAPASVGSANQEGSATSLSRSDHVHSHGDQGGGSLHAAAVAAGAAGFMTGSDKDKLDNIPSNATAPTSTPPVNVTKAAAAVGSSGEAARADHKHDVDTGTPGTTSIGASAAEGSAASLARSDHTHAMGTPGAPAAVTKSPAQTGSSDVPARSDHKHDVTTAAPQTVGTSNAEGVATSLSRSDHVHSHGDQAGGTLHAAATTGTAGFMSSADKTAHDSVVANAVRDGDFAGTDPGFLHRTGPNTYEAIKSNLSATTNPTVSSDSTQGYQVGSEWVNTSTLTAFKCLDASVGAAVWTTISEVTSPFELGRWRYGSVAVSRWNSDSATKASVTSIDINDVDLDALDQGAVLGALASIGTEIYIQRTLDEDDFMIVQIDSRVDNGTSWNFTVSFVDEGGPTTLTAGGGSDQGYRIFSLGAGGGGGTGDVTGPAGGTVDGDSAVFADATGKVIRRRANNQAASDPTASNDNTQGYEILSRWVNTSSDEEFVCLDASTGAAVWASTTSGGTGGISAADLRWKQPVRAATTGSGILATSFENGDFVDGVTLATGDRILIKDQAAGSENGIYIVQASGAPLRATDLAAGNAAASIATLVSEGTINGGNFWRCSNVSGSDVVNTDALTFAELQAGLYDETAPRFGRWSAGSQGVLVGPGKFSPDQPGGDVTDPSTWSTILIRKDRIDGSDMTEYLKALGPGCHLALWDNVSESAVPIMFRFTGNPTESTNYIEIPLEYYQISPAPQVTVLNREYSFSTWSAPNVRVGHFKSDHTASWAVVGNSGTGQNFLTFNNAGGPNSVPLNTLTTSFTSINGYQTRGYVMPGTGQLVSVAVRGDLSGGDAAFAYYVTRTRKTPGSTTATTVRVGGTNFFQAWGANVYENQVNVLSGLSNGDFQAGDVISICVAPLVTAPQTGNLSLELLVAFGV